MSFMEVLKEDEDRFYLRTSEGRQVICNQPQKMKDEEIFITVAFFQEHGVQVKVIQHYHF